MSIGVIGLTDDGWKLAINLKNAGHEILAFDENKNLRKQIEAQGIKTFPYLDEFAFNLESKRVIWIFQPDEQKMNDLLEHLVPHLSVSDILVILNPANLENTVRRCQEVQGLQIDLLDCSFHLSATGSLLAFIGGNKFAFNYCDEMFQQLASVKYCGLCGTGMLEKRLA